MSQRIHLEVVVETIAGLGVALIEPSVTRMMPQ